MLLAIVIRWGASHVTLEYHARQYKEYMRAYQTCLKTIFPVMEWRPNHHASLHLDDFIRRYVWAHAWVVDVPLREGHRRSEKNKYEPQDWLVIVIVIYQISDLQTGRT